MTATELDTILERRTTRCSWPRCETRAPLPTPTHEGMHEDDQYDETWCAYHMDEGMLIANLEDGTLRELLGDELAMDVTYGDLPMERALVAAAMGRAERGQAVTLYDRYNEAMVGYWRGTDQGDATWWSARVGPEGGCWLSLPTANITRMVLR